MKECIVSPQSWLMIVCCFILGNAAETVAAEKIDRHALVLRHNITYNQPELTAPLTVGNGKFAFTVDPTGMQNFAESYDQGVPLSTMSEWGWHNMPNPNNYRIEDVYKPFDSHGRKVLYAYDSIRDPMGSRGKKEGQFGSPAAEWLYENPHRIGLGRIGMILSKTDGTSAAMSDLKNIRQHLDLWTGCLESYFELEGVPVTVQTVVHPELDMAAFRVESPLIVTKQIKIEIHFPYVNGLWQGGPEDWNSPDKHTTQITAQSNTRVDFQRQLDDTVYHCAVTFPETARLKKQQQHQYILSATKRKRLDFAVTFSETNIPKKLPTVSKTLSSVSKYWKRYWTEGAMVDLSESKDPRWKELEKRIVLSQYVTAVNCAGSLPPQESGLVMNTWYGKFHLEMHFWHDAHFAMWDRLPLMMRSMDYYRQILPYAKGIAQRQGYKGARWPKMVGPEGREAPNSINPFLIWQQPHPLYYAELCYRQNPTKQTLDYWWDVVRETADFMATFAVLNPETGIYDLGPPINDVGERATIDQAKNPPFEVAYWRFGLQVAQQWRQRMGMPPDAQWAEVLAHLAPLEVRNGRYLAARDVFGTLPIPEGTDPEILEKSIKDTVKNLRNGSCSWGYPLAAMAAARAGQPDLAVEALLYPSISNGVSDAGYNYWMELVPIYLPGNGALLSAVAMMAGGWDSAPERNAPGFPNNGQWVVKSEGLHPLP